MDRTTRGRFAFLLSSVAAAILIILGLFGVLDKVVTTVLVVVLLLAGVTISVGFNRAARRKQ
ncbi:hypothetical protein KIPE111705_20550 [Kibdelosporangium persicum]